MSKKPKKRGGRRLLVKTEKIPQGVTDVQLKTYIAPEKPLVVITLHVLRGNFHAGKLYEAAFEYQKNPTLLRRLMHRAAEALYKRLTGLAALYGLEKDGETEMDAVTRKIKDHLFVVANIRRLHNQLRELRKGG